MDEGQIALLLRDGDTGLPAYSDTGYSDTGYSDSFSVHKKRSPYTENPGYSDILLTVTLFAIPTLSL